MKRYKCKIPAVDAYAVPYPNKYAIQKSITLIKNELYQIMDGLIDRWVNVNERLPHMEVPVMIHGVLNLPDGNHSIYFLAQIKQSKQKRVRWQCCNSKKMIDRICKVTHWIPFPTAPDVPELQ